jgi:hypothetical protein
LSKIGVDPGYTLDGTYVLVKDITLDDTWTPIGENSASPFTGKFFGGGRRIKNLVLPHNREYVGLFGYTSGAAIQDLVIELDDTPIAGAGTLYAGAAAGYARNSVFTNITVKGSLNVSAGDQVYAGGIAGYHYSSSGGGAIANCSAEGDITASASFAAYAGGIAGYNSGGSITIASCSAEGAITASASGYAFAGGIAGCNSGGSIAIANCSAGGAISASDAGNAYAGGIAGYNLDSGSVTIESCAAAGDISAAASGYAYAGGIAGCNGSAGNGSSVIKNCAALTSGVTATAGTNARRIIGAHEGTGTLTLANNIALDTMTLNGGAAGTGASDGPDGLGKTAAELQSRGTYSDSIPGGGLGWDFESVWKWDGTRPILFR